MVHRQRCSDDRRVIYVAISGQALKLLASLDRPVQGLQQQLLAHLKPAELKTLIVLLERVRQRATSG